MGARHRRELLSLWITRVAAQPAPDPHRAVANRLVLRLLHARPDGYDDLTRHRHPALMINVYATSSGRPSRRWAEEGCEVRLWTNGRTPVHAFHRACRIVRQSHMRIRECAFDASARAMPRGHVLRGSVVA